MIRKFLVIAILVFFCHIELNAQDSLQIEITNYNYWDGITNKYYYIENLYIDNRTGEDYVTWVSQNPIKNQIHKDLLHEYFYKRKADFSFMDMINDNLLSEISL